MAFYRIDDDEYDDDDHAHNAIVSRSNELSRSKKRSSSKEQSLSKEQSRSKKRSSSNEPSRTVPDPNPNANTTKLVVIVMLVIIAITTLCLLTPYIVRTATYSQGFLKGMLKEYTKYKKTSRLNKSWLSSACSVSKPITIPVVTLFFFKQVADQNKSLLFPLLMVLPFYCADIATMIAIIALRVRIVKWNKNFLCHVAICLSMWEFPIENIWIVLAQALLSYWYLNREDESSVESYASVIAQCLEHAWSLVRKTVGSWEDFAWVLREQMGWGKRPIVYDDETKRLGYRMLGEGRVPAPLSGRGQASLGPRGRSPGRRP